mmetsp:Transcript_22261/g.35403  ORF Transcript_22261/g.35403 Transcript_22261/m.35403 type:complete len:202 (-) Transcript_22261:5167-5772(-)
MRHIAHGIEVHEGGDRGHDNQHDRGQTVNTDRPGGVEVAGLYEVQNVDLFDLLGVKAKEDNPAQEASPEQDRRSDVLRSFFANQAPSEASDQGTDKRPEENERFHDRLAFHHVDVFDRDGATVPEEGDQDRQADGGFCGGYGHYEERKDLAGEVTEVRRKRHQVDVHRQQDEFDRHQQDDDVLPVQEEAENADDEKRRRHA